VYWTFSNLGPNLTDTVVTRRVHTLVTLGPYRWVRHPFYGSVTLLIVALALLAANWFFLLMGSAAVALLVIRTRREEELLVARFGDSYRGYMARTGRFLPRGLPTLAGLALIPTVLQSQAPATHRFVPTQFYTTYSFAHPPALRIKPGDRVITKTIDAGGTDWDGKSISPGGNPQTGPFYIEGAEPDDAIVVTFEKIETNRSTGYSGSLLAPYTVDPAAIAARTERDPKRMIWNIDKAKSIVSLDSPDIKPSHLEVPLRPMLGCVGVAPARKEAIAAVTPGAFGGNMDYAGLGAGTKLMLPVYEPGALLFMGDGHARMGEGEAAGTGVETSMDVEFTVALIKKKPIAWPRLENADHIMVLGSARPLLEAFQRATTEMHRWLMADYGFSERGASTFMGQALEYEIANVVDPNFTVVAKMRKSLLRGVESIRPSSSR
jgi:acetamidase/formamidase